MKIYLIEKGLTRRKAAGGFLQNLNQLLTIIEKTPVPC